MPNITKQTVDAASPASKKHFLWDRPSEHIAADMASLKND
jgi:hypothetical protein